jgi:hypothetical protein
MSSFPLVYPNKKPQMISTVGSGQPPAKDMVKDEVLLITVPDKVILLFSLPISPYVNLIISCFTLLINVFKLTTTHCPKITATNSIVEFKKKRK